MFGSGIDLGGDVSAGAMVDWEPLGGGDGAGGDYAAIPSRFGASGSVHRDMWLIWIAAVLVLVFVYGALRSY